MGVAWNRGTPISSIFMGFSTINNPFWSILGIPHLRNPPYTYVYKYIYIYMYTYVYSIMYYISCHQAPAMASCRSSAARPVSHPTDAATARQCWTLDTVPESNCTASQTCAWGAWGWICITVRGDDIVAMLHIHVCTCMYMYIHLDTSIYKCIYIYICMYLYMYL